MRPPYIYLEVDGRSVGPLDLPRTLCAHSGQQYEIQIHQGAGGNASVFSATGVAQRGMTVAIKFQRRLNPVSIDRFANEQRIHSSLAGQNIAQYYDSGDVLVAGYQVPWIALERGTMNLREHIERLGPLDPKLLLSVANNMCQALEAVHKKKIVHRDVKPANFVWSMNGYDALMIDFGIAKFVGEDIAARPFDELTRLNEFVGPQAYSSPELLAYARNKHHPVDYRSDIFQFGKVLWFLATGMISAGIPSKHRCPLGGALYELVVSCLNDSPDDRPPSIASVYRSLREIPSP